MTPQEIIYKHRDLLSLAVEHGYIPNKDQGNFGEVKAALQKIDGVSRESSCSGCISEIIRMANVHLKNYSASLSKDANFHTFPKHEKDQEATGEGIKTFGANGRKNKGKNYRDGKA